MDVDDCLDYSSDPEDIKMPFQDISHSPETLIYITDLTIECSSNGSEQDVIDTLAIQIFGAADENNVSLLHLEKIVENGQGWKYNGQIERSISHQGITFLVQSGQGYPLGYYHVTSKKIGKFSVQAKSNDKWTCTLDAAGNKPILKLSCNLSTTVGSRHVKEEGEKKMESGLLDKEKNGCIEQAQVQAHSDEEAARWTERRNMIFGIISQILDVLDDGGWEQAQIADKLLRQCFQTGDQAHISEIISAYQKAINLTPDGYAAMAQRLGNLANAFSRRFNHTGDMADISEAISVHQRAINLTSDGHSDMAQRLGSLANAFSRRFDHTGDMADISEAISVHQRAINLTPDGHADMAWMLGNLANALSSRFDHTGDMVDILEAISVHKRAINLTPDGHSDMAWMLGNLASAFSSCFGHTGDMADISEAISVHQRAINLTPDRHSAMAQRLAKLANAFSRRFNHTGNMADISEAISVHQRAINLTPDGHAAMAWMLGNLASAFSICFDHTGDIADISEAISVHKRAINLTPDGHSDMARMLGNLANAFSRRFNHTGDMADISEAISVHQRAINLTPDGHSDMAQRLGNLANAFSRRFDHTGDMADISEAISVHQRAINLTPDGHAAMAQRLGNLANAFSRRFNHTGDMADISEAISVHQRAINLIPDGHSDMAWMLGNLASAFWSRFIHTGDIADISEAISVSQRAINLTPDGHSEMAQRLGNLANAFWSRFGHTGDMADISEAISVNQRAINLAPDGHSDMAQMLANLASAFLSRFDYTGDMADISEAISVNQRAITLTPNEHSVMALRLANLAHAFYLQFIHESEDVMLQEALFYWRQSALHSSGSTLHRFRSAIPWATLSEQLKHSDQTLEAYEVAINLLSQVVGMQKTTQRQHSDMTQFSNFPRQAAAYACSIGHPDRAIEWLEQGRCIVWSHLNCLRSPLDELHHSQPQLADEFKRTSHQLEMAASRSEHILSNTMEQQMSQQQEAHNHLQLAKKREQLLTQIRDIPQFKNFLQPQPCSELLNHLPESGPVVVINVHSSRCDALALVHGLDSPLHIPLPKISLEDAEVLYECLQICMGNNRGDNSHNTDVTNERKFSRHIPETGPGIQYILHELWDCVVKPILDRLDYLSSPDPLPHIWWCATGPLALLPIHAAGIYSTSSLTQTTHPACTLSYFAVSSYIPTVTTLTERVKNIHQMQNIKTRLFMISQPDTPGQSEIPGTKKEVEAVEELLKPHDIEVSCLHRSSATVEQVIANMDTHSCVHFASHASQHPDDPLESAFFLHDGKLKLSTIIKKNLTGADLAFLSACQTSVGDKKLQDEAVHLAAGMLAAGYRGVVATMWSIKDGYAPQVATDFYAQLINEAEKGGQKEFDGRNAAFSIHHAIQKLRNEIGDNEQSLLAWVPYVHFGL